MYDPNDERPPTPLPNQGDGDVAGPRDGPQPAMGSDDLHPSTGAWAAVTLPPRRRRGGHGGGRWSRRAGRLLLFIIVPAAIGVGAAVAYHDFHQPTIAVARPASPQQLQALPAGKLNASALASRVEPAVVDITVSLAAGQGSAAGTGMILTSSGEVLTNNHVVDGASIIQVKIHGRAGVYNARVLGVDPTKDVALLQLEGVSGLPTVTLAGSAPYVGESVVAIGNALDLKGPPTVTEGTVTALNRAITATDDFGGNSEHLVGMMQTDAALAPGDSGGPLINALGQVVGMDTAAYAGSPTPSFSDVGFAIPIATALQIVEQIQAGDSSPTVLIGARPMMGVEVIDPSVAGPAFHPAVQSGALVVKVVTGSPAAAAGLVPNDVIVGFDGQTVTSVEQLSHMEQRFVPGDSVTVTWVTASGKKMTARVRLVPGPAV